MPPSDVAGRETPLCKQDRTLRIVSLALVCLPVLFNLFCLYPEISISHWSLNDDVLHFAASHRMSQALTSGENPVDSWLGACCMGYPFWRYYQPVPHLVTAVAFRVTGPWLEPRSVFLLINYLLLSFFPLSLYALARSLGLGRLASGAAAALSVLPSGAEEFGRFGISYGSYVWRGSGLTTQLWGLAAGLPALAYFLRAIRRGRGLVLAGALMALAVLCHIAVGYIVIVSAILLVLIGYGNDLPGLRQRLFRGAVIGAVTCTLLAWFVIPMAIDRLYIHSSHWWAAETWRVQSFGAGKILGSLCNGTFLDDQRLPILTVLFGAGLVLAFKRRRQDRLSLALLALALFWLAAFFGPATWGRLLDFIMPGEMQVTRFQLGFEVFAVLLAALALERLVLALGPAATKWRLAAATLCLLAALAPMYAERKGYLRTNATWGESNRAAFHQESRDLEALLQRLKNLTETIPGRVHAGRAGDWGGQFKIGSVPLFSVFPQRDIPATGYLWYTNSLAMDTMPLLQEWRPGDLQLFGVRYMVVPTGLAVTSLVIPRETFGRFALYEVPNSGFFDIVSVPYAIEEDLKTTFASSEAWMAHPLRQSRQYLALYPAGEAPARAYKRILHPGDPFPMPSPADNPPAGAVLSESRAGEVYHARVRAGGSCYVLFRSSFHPGLKAEVDGARVEPVMVTPGLMAIPVTAGSHGVAVFYEAGMLKPLLAILGLLIAGLAGFASRRSLFQRLETALATLGK
jgi:hypothetical protein